MSQFVSYQGKRVVVTGAASGMGAATAEIVSGLGGEVIALDLRKPETPVASYVEIDLADRASIESAIAELGDGPVHALFNCAGLPNTFPGQQVMSVNFLGHRHLTEALIPRMPAGSAIAFVSSVAGMNWMAHAKQIRELYETTAYDEAHAWCHEHQDLVAEGYAFSKEAITYYAMARAIPLLEVGIRLNCISPGPTATAMLKGFEDANGKDFMDSFPKPIGRTSTAAEQANALVFLNSDAASYVAGHNLMSDGGFLAAMMTGQVDMSLVIPASMS